MNSVVWKFSEMHENILHCLEQLAYLLWEGASSSPDTKSIQHRDRKWVVPNEARTTIYSQNTGLPPIVPYKPV